MKKSFTERGKKSNYIWMIEGELRYGYNYKRHDD